MSRFVCTADLHLGAGADLLPPGERLVEQEEALGRIVDLANELEAGLIWAGDAWERRRPTPQEILAFRRPLDRLVGPLVAIAGNHDVETLERPTGYETFWRADADRQLVTRPWVTRALGVSIACLPWAPAGRPAAAADGADRDEVNRAMSAGLLSIARDLLAKCGDGPKILVGHWSVAGAIASSGLPVSLFREPVLELDELAAMGWDAIVLGHIHRPQMLGDGARPIFYAGSPMPLNFGEAEHDHVAWLLELDRRTKSASAFQIPLESTALKTYDLVAETVGPDVGVTIPLDYDGAIVKLRIQADEEQAARLDLPGLRRSLLEPREIASGTMPPARRVWAIQVDVQRAARARLEGVDETISEDDALSLWLQANGHGQSEALFELHRDYIIEAGVARAAGAGAFSPTRLRLRNYRTFRELDLVLPAGVVAIIGENGAGKSSLVSAIELALFGPAGRSWAPYLTTGSIETELLVELDFDLGETSYRVRRGYSAKGSGKTTLDLERHAAGEWRMGPEWEPVTFETQARTQEAIEELLGLTRETFRASAMLSQGDGAAFTEAKPSDRKRILGGVLGLGRYERLNELARRDYRETERQIDRISATLETADVDLAALPDATFNLERLGQEADDLGVQIEERTTRLQELAARKDELQRTEASRGVFVVELQAAETTLAGVESSERDAIDAEESLRVLTDEQETLPTPTETQERERQELELVQAIEAYRSAIQRAQETAREIELRTAERRALEARAQDLRAKIGETQRTIEKLETSTSVERCEVCTQTLGEEAREATILSLRARIQELEDESMAFDEQAAGVTIPEVVEPPEPPVSDPVVELASVRDWLRKARELELQSVRLQERRRVLEERIAKRPTAERREKASQDVQEACRRLESAGAEDPREELSAIASEAQAAALMLKGCETALGRVREEAGRQSGELERLQKLQTATADDRARREALQTGLDRLRILQAAYGRSGIPAAIIEQAAIPSIETEAGRLLAELGASYRLELRTQRETQGGELRDALDVVVHTEAGERPYETFSGGERTRINLALRIALARLLAHRRGAESRLLAIDEPEFLDQAGTAALARVLHRLDGDFDRVYLISHVPDLRDSFAATVEVIRNGDRSEVQ